MEKTDRISLAVQPAMKAKLKAYADSQYQSISSIFMLAINEYLTKRNIDLAQVRLPVAAAPTYDEVVNKLGYTITQWTALGNPPETWELN